MCTWKKELCPLFVEWKDFQLTVNQVYSSSNLFSSWLFFTTAWFFLMVLLSSLKSKSLPFFSGICRTWKKEPGIPENCDSSPFCESVWSFFHFINTMQFWLFIFFHLAVCYQRPLFFLFFTLSVLIFQIQPSFQSSLVSCIVVPRVYPTSIYGIKLDKEMVLSR